MSEEDVVGAGVAGPTPELRSEGGPRHNGHHAEVLSSREHQLRTGPEISETATSYEVDADLIHYGGRPLVPSAWTECKSLRQDSCSPTGIRWSFKQDIGWLTLFENARILSQDTVSGGHDGRSRETRSPWICPAVG